MTNTTLTLILIFGAIMAIVLLEQPPVDIYCDADGCYKNGFMIDDNYNYTGPKDEQPFN